MKIARPREENAPGTRLKTIEDALARFRGTSEAADDATLMTVKVG